MKKFLRSLNTAFFLAMLAISIQIVATGAVVWAMRGLWLGLAATATNIAEEMIQNP